jgi:hypothetical protein
MKASKNTLDKFKRTNIPDEVLFHVGFIHPMIPFQICSLKSTTSVSIVKSNRRI